MDNFSTRTTKNAQETQKVGQDLAAYFLKKIEDENFHGPVIVCLYGQLGSGKTTFTQGFARGLGIQNRLLSPTFIISRMYEISSLNRQLVHLDCYRITKESEIRELGFSEQFADKNNLVVIEWADRIKSILPDRRIDITFDTILDDIGHRITIGNDSYGFSH